MSNALIVKNKKKANQNPLQQMFYRLKNRVEALQKDCIECSQTLDRHLEIYNTMLFPQEKQIGALLRQEIRMFSPFLKNKKQFKKNERAVLEQIIEDLFEKISLMEGPDMLLDEELSKVFKEVVGFSPQDEQISVFERFKKEAEEDLARKGIHIDLSDVQMEGSIEDAINKIMDSMMEQGAFFKENEEDQIPPTKSKKEIEREKKALELETLQKKEIGTIYKQLAKAVHPDLETDPSLKVEKEALMKRLTSAYEDRDLLTLLSLELEVFSVDGAEEKNRSENQLKVYNHLLKTQINELQDRLRVIPMGFKYIALQRYVQYWWKKGDFALRQIQNELNIEIKTHKKIVEQCEKGNTLQLIREAIEERLDTIW